MLAVFLAEVRVAESVEPGPAREVGAAALRWCRARHGRPRRGHGALEEDFLEVLVEEARENARRHVLRVLPGRIPRRDEELLERHVPVARRRDDGRPGRSRPAVARTTGGENEE